MPFAPPIPKTPTESFLVGIDFDLALPSGRSLASGSVAAYDEAGIAAPSLLASTAINIVGTQALARVQNGVAGVSYRIVFSMLLDDGEAIQDGLMLAIGGLTGPS